MTLSAAGVLDGPVTAAGSYTFTVEVTSASMIDTQALTLTVNDPPLVIDTSSPLPAGQRNVAYSVALMASGGSGTYSWTVTSGTLPVGITLASNGTLAGTTDEVPKTYMFRATVTSGSQTAFRDYDLKIDP
jgi:hypothetical protein